MPYAHLSLPLCRNDKWAGEIDREDVKELRQRILGAYARALKKQFGLGKPDHPYKCKTDLSARTEWLSTQYFEPEESVDASYPWANVSQDMSLRYLGKWDLEDGFTDEMFSQFYMAGSAMFVPCWTCNDPGPSPPWPQSSAPTHRSDSTVNLTLIHPPAQESDSLLSTA